jgi:glucan biosynthesis protein
MREWRGRRKRWSAPTYRNIASRVWYNNRPSAWVETKGEWPKGSIELVELTAPNETFDNIVAFWNPAAPPPRAACA